MALPQREHTGPHWTNGHTGPLIAGKTLTVRLSRPETGAFVHSSYAYDPEEAENSFNAFLGLRVQHEAQLWAKPGGPRAAYSLPNSASAHAKTPNAVSLRPC